MPYLQRGTDTPFGLMPYDKILSIGHYRKGSDSSTIFRGDIVTMASDGEIDPLAAATTTPVLGVAVAHVASTSADTAVAIYDHPDQLFTVQDDSDTTTMTATSIGNSVAPIGFTGNSTTLQSNTEADSSTADTAVRMLKVIRLHPIETGFAAAAGAQRKWVVKINPYFHYHATANAV